MAPRLRFDRNEFSGAFGDIGTDLPLIFGMILASGIDPASVLIIFGGLQIASALIYGIPMPVQPLKAVAAIVIADGIAGPTIFGAGLAIGLTMLVLTVTGLLTWLERVIPKAVIRGIQFGLGAKLALLALSNYVQADGPVGYIPAVLAFAVTIALMGNRKFPPALVVIAIGLVYAFATRLDIGMITSSVGFSLPELRTPRIGDVAQGFLLLALPQIPLSLGNSIFATQLIAGDLFPEKRITVKKIGTTYSLMNITAPFLSGLPVCHGSGGIAGHYAFGGRTGGSAFIYGAILASLGLFFGHGSADVIKIFPLPILGVILMFEGLTLMRFLKDTVGSNRDFFTALLVGAIAVGLPYGFLIGIVVGCVVWYVGRTGA